MSYINVGVYLTEGMERVKTKGQLKELIKSDPDLVTFDQTSAYGEGSGFLKASEIPDGDYLIVVGPDPYTARKWYANVIKTAAGKIKVS